MAVKLPNLAVKLLKSLETANPAGIANVFNAMKAVSSRISCTALYRKKSFGFSQSRLVTITP